MSWCQPIALRLNVTVALRCNHAQSAWLQWPLLSDLGQANQHAGIPRTVVLTLVQCDHGQERIEESLHMHNMRLLGKNMGFECSASEEPAQSHTSRKSAASAGRDGDDGAIVGRLHPAAAGVRDLAALVSLTPLLPLSYSCSLGFVFAARRQQVALLSVLLTLWHAGEGLRQDATAEGLASPQSGEDVIGLSLTSSGQMAELEHGDPASADTDTAIQGEPRGYEAGARLPARSQTRKL